MRCVGILGGSFDPIHLGHLRMAVEALDAFALDTVCLIPSGIPPHREPPHASAFQRMAMIEAALNESQNPKIQYDTWELNKNSPAYTVETLRYLNQKEPESRYVWILGMDSFLSFLEWDFWEEILERAHLMVVPRPGFELSLPYCQLLKARAVPGSTPRSEVFRTVRAGYILIHQPQASIGVSSTVIRHLVASGQSPQFLVPEAVKCYLKKELLYQGEDFKL